MTSAKHKTKLEFGDFQTPLELADKVCQKLIKLELCPNVIIEPTCGVGNFIEAAANRFQSTSKIVGLDINSDHLIKAEKLKNKLGNEKIDLINENFFIFDWFSLLNSLDGNILVLGNFPWVTNSQQGIIGGMNLPKKNNFQNYNGLDAMTGKSNFDISEWMLIQVVQWLQKRDGNLAMLCKTSVARKLLKYLHSNQLNLSYCATYKIDAKRYFNANVEACLLFCKFYSKAQNYFCDVFSSLESFNSHRIGYQDNILIRDIDSFEKVKIFYDKNAGVKWRSGIKHDCSDIMEFRKIGNSLINGLGEVIDIEDTYLFPLLKGSNIAQNIIDNHNRYLLVTQKFIGEPTECIKYLAPKTWKYLESHARYLDNRKSKIYQNTHRFSIFGVGAYSFTPCKIAICGLYKKLDFKMIGKINDKTVVFDDTVYFLGFEDEEIANKTLELLNSSLATNFYSSLIFWDEKRPIKSSILNSLNLAELARTISLY
ncbi:SAM-dependent methyltransferase [Pelatocladus sp. BLCC-F211]|uniref:SAM-dependent methyltransferase n=1 Tax=Pelatocladus sp. BLCC-F211 TaxID=3342752 RepID=UPI0035B7E256